MAILDIINYPDARLYTVAKPVSQVDAKIQRLIDDMAETMYEAPGIGLAATQVDVHLQIIVIDISETKKKLQVFINPKVKTKAGTQEYEEGCLSVPGVYENVTRAETVVIEALDRNGKPFILEADGLLAVCIPVSYTHLTLPTNREV